MHHRAYLMNILFLPASRQTDAASISKNLERRGKKVRRGKKNSKGAEAYLC